MRAMKREVAFLGLATVVGVSAFVGANCKAGSGATSIGGSGGGNAGGAGVTSTGTMSTNVTGTNSTTGTGFGTSSASTGSVLMGDPTTCAEAAMYKTYLGCDFYPTVTANPAWSIFDFAAVVANAGTTAATVTVTKGGSPVGSPITIQPNQLGTVYLPWIPALKGADQDCEGGVQPFTPTVSVPNGAYHLVSTVPVTVYQFNALEYAPAGGPPGKDWSTCPANQCGIIPCFSYTNDASLLLPSTALTDNYRVLGYPGWSLANMPPTLTITGTQDTTKVTVTLSPTGSIAGGGGIPSGSPGQAVTFSINEGQVVELVGASASADFSGSLVQTDKPVQVITGLPCTDIPDGAQACDHIEQSVFPAETLGKHYIVARPTGPNGTAVGAVMILYGNKNGTHLTYPSGAVPGAPATLNAGQVANLGVVNSDFEVSGDNEFGVAIFQQGGSVVDPNAPSQMQNGDPAQSLEAAVEQYRTKYVFLAPTDYPKSFADIVVPPGAMLTLDGAPVTTTPQGIGASTYKIVRLPLTAGAGKGAHVLESTLPVGLQVIGYGLYTSYQYPGGLNLNLIAPPPPPPA